MQVKPLGANQRANVTISTPEHVQKAKAVAAFKAGTSSFDAAQQTEAAPQIQHSQQAQPIVNNQNNISPEEFGAIIPKPNIDTVGSIEQPVEVTKVSQPDPQVVEQFAKIARQERQLRAKAQQQDQQLRAREQALAEKEAQLAARDQDYSQNYIQKDRIKSDFITVAEQTGLTYDDIAQQYLNLPNKDPRVDAKLAELDSKIKQLDKARELDLKAQQDRDAGQYQAAVKQISIDADRLVKTDPTFEAIRTWNATKDVVKLIETHFKETGEALSVEEAAGYVEDELIERTKKLTSIKKIQKPVDTLATASTSQQQSVSKQSQPMKTLTNATSSTRQLSAKERAILAFKGELKS